VYPLATAVVITLAMVFNYTNGFHDAANAIATSVSTRALTPRVALAMAAVMNFVGAFLGQEVADTVGSVISPPPGVPGLVIVLAGLIGAIAWNLITWRFGLPSSSSQALIGGLVGAAIASGTMVEWNTVIDKVVIPMLLSPVVAFVILKQGVENNAAYARLVMEAADREWRATQATGGKPLKLIAGPFVLVSSASFYGADKPSTLAEFSPYLSPWADTARILREGMAIMCEAGDPNCLKAIEIFSAISPGGRRTEVTLTRRWLGFENAPKRFMIATIPPRQ